MNTRKISLPLLDYNDANFSANSFDALKKYGALILTNVPKISEESALLFQSYDKYWLLPKGNIDEFRAGNTISDLTGFHSPEFHWGGRRFSGCYGILSNGKGDVAQPLPTENFKNAAVDFLNSARKISDKVLSAIGEGFQLGSEWSTYFIDHPTLGIADSYVPPTQEKIQDLHSQGQITLTKDDSLIAFAPHHDVTPVTVLVYHNNDSSGLEMKIPDSTGKLKYEKITLPETEPGQVTPLVLVGSPMQELTAGQIRAPKHRVVIDPLQSGEYFSRKLASAFTLFGPNSTKPKPLVSSPSTEKFPTKEFDVTAYYEDKYDEVNKERIKKSRDLLPGFLARFPQEAEIEQVNSFSEGIKYQRR